MTFSMPFKKATRLRALTFGVLALGLLSVQVGRGTLAFFTTQVTSTANVFTAGTLKLNIQDFGGDSAATTVTSSITFANMKPGDVVYAPIEIDNNGTLDAVYGIKYTTLTTGSQDLAPGLKLAILGTGASGTGTNDTTSLDAHACNAQNFATPAGIWPEAVRSAAFMVATAGEVIIAPHSAPGVTGWPVLSTAKDILCLQVAFTDPGSANNTYNNIVNGATNTTVAFTFDGLVSAAPVITLP